MRLHPRFHFIRERIEYCDLTIMGDLYPVNQPIDHLNSQFRAITEQLRIILQPGVEFVVSPKYCKRSFMGLHRTLLLFNLGIIPFTHKLILFLGQYTRKQILIQTPLQAMQFINLSPTRSNIMLDCFNLYLLLIGLIRRQPEATQYSVQLLL